MNIRHNAHEAWGPSTLRMSYQLARNYLLPGNTLSITESALV